VEDSLCPTGAGRLELKCELSWVDIWAKHSYIMNWASVVILSKLPVFTHIWPHMYVSLQSHAKFKFKVMASLRCLPRATMSVYALNRLSTFITRCIYKCLFTVYPRIAQELYVYFLKLSINLILENDSFNFIRILWSPIDAKYIKGALKNISMIQNK
jgi:hypothetical protein